MKAGAEKSKRPAKPAGGGAERKAIYLVYGEDEYRVRTRAKELVDSLCPPAEAAFGLEIIDAAVENAAEGILAVRRALEALRTVGFLGGRKTVWLRDATLFTKDIAEDLKRAVEELTDQIKAGLPVGQTLVVSALKVFRGSAFFKACEAAGTVEECAKPDKPWQQAEYARGQVMEEFRRHGLKPVGRALDLFLDRVGMDTRSIVQEAEKLAVYLGGRKDARPEDVQAIVSLSRESAAWDLADAVGARDLQGALKILRQLVFQGESAIGLLHALEFRFREMIVFREALDRGWARPVGEGYGRKLAWREGPEIDAALKALGKDPREGHWFRGMKLAEQAQRFSAAQLRDGHAILLKAHEAMVSSSVPDALQMELLLLKLLAPSPRDA
ncbi:MAG TPA: DNA polymerase III subunit delta [Kiritimatiellia bacterium]|nr:DNA polymerase III subunit delta [Kiritimatiellia bacterium]HRZ11440.1 DNA polymerase III subunit delta [Kiritimatiellia bacterium]HSA17009.1 DNA polymerase III subunit delta [Kiritimatiellia bacterium]